MRKIYSTGTKVQMSVDEYIKLHNSTILTILYSPIPDEVKNKTLYLLGRLGETQLDLIESGEQIDVSCFANLLGGEFVPGLV